MKQSAQQLRDEIVLREASLADARRELAAGEAYRVPALPGLTAEVSNPASAELFENGASKGSFTAAQMPLKTVG